MNNPDSANQIIWWKDKKLLAGFTLVFLSFVLGFYGKLVFISRFYKPIGLITGLSLWAFSWLLLFLGVFIVGWETVKMIQHRIQSHVKKTVKETYNYTKNLPKKSYDYTRELHKKGIQKIKKSLSKND
ncbi:hypothetical protein HYY70_03865 [Candidatus Woesearchaeota archaeon]|nr:hypothetical protein [Candidatus Woesearchaeota archaeon]